MAALVSQEFFQTMATPKFSAFGYFKMEFIEKNKNNQIWGNFFSIFKIENLIKKWKFHGVVQYTYGCSGKRNGRVSWRKPIKNHLGSLVKVSRRNYCSSAGRFSDVAEKQ